VTDRHVGAVLAAAAGDALGAGYEFGPPLPDDEPVYPKGGGGFGWAPGEWTDDTQMAACVLAVLADGSTEVDRIAASFREWFGNGPADVGIQTSAVLSTAGDLLAASQAYAVANPDRSAGNGSLMRTSPVALAAPGDPGRIARLAADISALTHADVDCQDACVLWSIAIDHQVHHAPASDVPWSFADAVRVGLDRLPATRRGRWAGLIDEAAASSPRAFPNNGWVVHAFQAALAAACSTPVPDGPDPAAHLQLALEAAVRCGGDTDTVAAIAGGLLGSRWGATAVPSSWRRILHGHAANRTPALRAADLDAWARLAAATGRPDPHGWPGRSSMIEHYLGLPVPPPGRHAELHGVRFGDVVTLGPALQDGVDTVVSLCRMGTDDVPEHVDHLVVGLHDTELDDNPNLVLLLEDVADHIQARNVDGRQVFVHCVAAENRTPTVAAAWLVRHHDHDPEAALRIAGERLNRPRTFLADGVRAVRPGSTTPSAG
jgi:ADP-ribosylglycohydrolase